MTREEKAKAYDEALERAREIKSKILSSHLSTESCKAVSEYIDTIIPELKESKDERIRKFIRSLLENARAVQSNTALYKEYDDALSWLEEQKDADKAIEAVERIDKYIDGHTANAHDMDDSHPDKKYYSGVDDTLSNIAGILNSVYSEEKQKGQKPIISDDAIREGVAHFGITQYQIDNWLKKHINVMEQKPVEPIEFNNEFENQVSHLLASALNGEHEYNEGFVKYAAQSLLGYAKKEQKPFNVCEQCPYYKDCPDYNEQNLAEWSDEDDQLIGFIFDLLNALVWRKDWAMSKEECLERLKSLRPQPHTVSVENSTKFGNLEYEQAEQNIVSLIESRIAEILGDAQPAPILRAELRGLIDKIKEESK